MRKLLLFLSVVFLLGVSDSGAKFYPSSKTFQKLAAGYAIGGLGWCIGVNLGNGIWKTTDAAAIGGYSLYGIGSSFGVWWAGSLYDDGKYLPTLLGTAIVPLLLTGAKEVFKIKSDGVNELIGFSLPIGAFIGYNLSCRSSSKGAPPNTSFKKLQKSINSP